jgi:hypothetical protein
MKRLPPKYEIEENDLNVDDTTLIKQYDQAKQNVNNLWWTPMFASVKRGNLPLCALMILSSLPMASANSGTTDEQSDGILFYAMVIVTLLVLVLERFVTHFGNRILSWMNTRNQHDAVSTSHQSSLSMPPMTTRSMPRSTASARSSMVQTDEIKNPNRLWTESDSASAGVLPDLQRNELERKLQQQEKELKQARNEITKLKQTIQNNNMSHGTKIREMQRQNDLLRNRVEVTNAPELTNEHIPDVLFFTANGECFHQASCPAIGQPHMRPYKLSKCKRCF